jgi:hypothetical protein
MAASTEEAYWGPIGWIAGGAATVGGAGIGAYNGYWIYQGQKQTSDWDNADLARCLANCSASKL